MGSGRHARPAMVFLLLNASPSAPLYKPKPISDYIKVSSKFTINLVHLRNVPYINLTLRPLNLFSILNMSKMYE
jgi:hypothetical protein